MIRFPKMHVAQSTANRIINIANGIESSAPPSVILPPGAIQNAQAGKELSAQLSTPPEAMSAPEGVEGPLVGAALTGQSLPEAAVSPILGGQSGP